MGLAMTHPLTPAFDVARLAKIGDHRYYALSLQGQRGQIDLVLTEEEAQELLHDAEANDNVLTLRLPILDHKVANLLSSLPITNA